MRTRRTTTDRTPALHRLGGILLPWLATLATLAAQSTEEFELRNGQRIPAADVKPSKAGFTATVPAGATTRAVNFTAKDIVRASLREPQQIAEARTLIASGKAPEAAILMEKLTAELEPLQGVPGAWWHLATMLQMDALATSGKVIEAESLATNDLLAKLPEATATIVADFQRIIAKPTTSPELKASGVEALARRITDPWIAARAWLELANLLSAQGKIEEAVKAWLRVPVFHAAETDLAVRGLVSAARGLQQIQRSDDGVKLLMDYLADHPGSPYAEPLRTEILKLNPTLKEKLAAPAAPGDAQPAQPAQPAPPADQPAGDQAPPATPPAKPATPPAKPATPPAKPATPPAKPATPPAKPAPPPSDKS
jgi:hypothetical protein